MGHDETLLGLVEAARGKLAAAKQHVEDTPKPSNACAAHDGFFALNQAIAGAVDIQLRIQEETLKEASKVTPYAQPAQPLTVWGFVCANARSVIWATALVLSVALIFGQLDALGDFVSRLKTVNCSASALQYEPSGG